HLDFSDDYSYLSWLFTVGEWTGAEFCAPQLGVNFPICASQLFAVRTRCLAHYSAPTISGRRVVFSCFTERMLLKRSQDEILDTRGYLLPNDFL
ncbi:hypothetical protein ARMGADRAFT_941228, partial [Armillaria gallica]